MSRRRTSQIRQRLRQTEEARQEHVASLLAAGEMIAGSFVTLGRKCGKPTCRCTKGRLHYSKFLSRSEGGKTQLAYVRSAHEVDVAQKAEQYRSFRQARAELMRLARQVAALVDELQQELTKPYPPPSRSGGRRPRPRKGGRGR